MGSRMLIVSSAALITVGLHGQMSPSRYGVAMGASVPQELKASTGTNLGLNIYFNQHSPSEGRLRLEGVTFGKKSENASFSVFESEGNAFTLAYDWTPGNDRVRAVLGLGAMAWTQKVQQFNLGYKSYGGSRSGFAVTPTLGIQFRLNKFISLEGRYTYPANVTTDKKYYFTYGADNSIRQMNYYSVGVEIRIPGAR